MIEHNVHADGADDVSPIYALADRYVEASCALDPIKATATGVPGFDDQLTDYSPEGAEARAELDRDVAAELAALEPRDHRDRVAAAYLTERLDTALAQADAREHLRAL